MKNKLFILGLFMLVALPASAVITVDGATDPESMRTRGYSEVMVDSVQNSKARANDEYYVNSVKKKYDESCTIVRGIRWFFNYIDPAYDNGRLMQHDIKYGPSVNDL